MEPAKAVAFRSRLGICVQMEMGRAAATGRRFTLQGRRSLPVQALAIAAAAGFAFALNWIASETSLLALALVAIVAVAAAVAGLSAGASAFAAGVLVLTQLRTTALPELAGWIGAAGTAALAAGILRQALDRAADRAERLERSRATLETSLREMSHRAKNGLAVLTAIVTQSARNAASAGELAQTLSKRFGALADAQDLITASHAPATDIARIVRRVLAPFVLERFALHDAHAPVLLGPDPTTTLALILHELATNAFKHGALRGAEGRVDIAWRAEGGAATVEWRESGGRPPTSADPAAGFGLRLVRTALAPYGGEATIEFAPEGFRCVLRMPKAP